MRVLLMLGLLALTCVNANKPLIRPSKPFNPLSSTVKAKIANHFAQHKSTHQSTIQSVQETIPTYDTAWYDAQRIDHFSFAVNPSTNRTTFSQKYLINRSYWRDPTLNLPGPIFLYTGNEGPIETFANNTGLMFDLASEFKALLVWVEHRYYGDTMPFGNQSYTNPSTMSYLTAEQALADYSQFIDWLRYDKNGPCFGKCGDIPVISFGGSYGGMLAAWFRMKYPAATQGAISASAPIWQQDNMVDPGAFNKILTNAFRRKVPQCPAGIARAWDVISYYAMANTTKVDNMTAVDYLTYVFKPLYKFNASTEEDQQTTINQLYGYLSSAYSYMGMANYPYPTEFLGSMPANPVDYACQLGFGAYQDINQASNQTILDGVYQIANVFWNYSQTVVKNDMSLNGPSTLGVGPDGWDYQSCTEMVMPLGQYGGTNDMFWPAPWSTDDFVAGCKAQYGVDADRKHMLIEWGGLHLESQSRIVFTNGDLDPWSGGGVTDTALNGAYSPSNTRGVVSYTITGGAHHLDLRFSDPADPQSVVWVRQQQRNFIHAWIDGYDSPSLENASSGLDEKWIILISVFATLLAVVLAAVLFHCCQTRRRKASQSGDYESMSH